MAQDGNPEPPQPAPYDSMNAQFYSSDPAAYFRMKLTLLLLVAGRENEVAALIDGGVDYLDLRLETETSGGDDADRATLQSYLVTETQALLHHAAETLVRLFLAHVEQPPCPWLEVAALLRFEEFRQRNAEVVSRAERCELDAAIHQVFLGAGEGADELIAPARQVLIQAGSRLRDEGKAYNSVKHGLSVISGQASLSIGPSDGSAPAFAAGGPSISYLEREKDPDGGATWYTRTLWVDVRSDLLLTQLLITMIESLWLIARARYVGSPLESIPVVTPEALVQLRESPTRPMMRNARFSLLKERPQPKAPMPGGGRSKRNRKETGHG